MKKIWLALLVVAGIAQAEVILGVDVSSARVNGELTASYMGSTDSLDYTDSMKALTLKGGYAWEQVRLLGYYSLEDYSASEGSKSYGVEVDYLIRGDSKTDMIIGLTLGKGELDAEGMDLGFTDVGAKVAIIQELNEKLGLEVGVQYKKRTFDGINIDGVSIEGAENQLGVYLGLNFSL